MNPNCWSRKLHSAVLRELFWCVHSEIKTWLNHVKSPCVSGWVASAFSDCQIPWLLAMAITPCFWCAISYFLLVRSTFLCFNSIFWLFDFHFSLSKPNFCYCVLHKSHFLLLRSPFLITFFVGESNIFWSHQVTFSYPTYFCRTYPLVNCHIAMANHHFLAGKIHYFYGHFQLLC